MSRHIGIGLLTLCSIVILTGCATKESKGNIPSAPSVHTPKKTEETTGTSQEVTTQTRPSEVDQQAKKQVLLETFGENWVNYSSVKERNNSVRGFMTSGCIEANGIDATTHAQFEAKGEITDIYQSISEEDTFLLTGVETTNGNQQLIVLTLTLTEEEGQFLISELTVSYVKQAY